MQHPKNGRRQALAWSAAGLLGLAAPALHAQSSRGQARLLVGFPPGGTADALARALQQRLPREEETLIVDNRPGAGGRLAVAELKHAPADGRTLMVSADPILTIYPHVFRRIAYDTASDVLPVAAIASESLCLAVGPMVPDSVRNLAGFVAWCRSQPKDAAYTTAAAGTTMHFVGDQFARSAKLDLLHVPHRGGAAAVQDVMGGQIASTVTPLSLAIPHLASGRLRAIAVAGERRSRRLPEVPTFAEQGHAQIRADVYYGAYLRAGTPAPIVARWHQAITQVTESAPMRSTLEQLSLEPLAMSQPAFAALVMADLQRWGPIVKASGYTADE